MDGLEVSEKLMVLYKKVCQIVGEFLPMVLCLMIGRVVAIVPNFQPVSYE